MGYIVQVRHIREVPFDVYVILSAVVRIRYLHHPLVLDCIYYVRYHERVLVECSVRLCADLAEYSIVSERVVHHRDHMEIPRCCIYEGVHEPVDLLLAEYRRHEVVRLREFSVIVVEGVKHDDAEVSHVFSIDEVYVAICPIFFRVAPYDVSAVTADKRAHA